MLFICQSIKIAFSTSMYRYIIYKLHVFVLLYMIRYHCCWMSDAKNDISSKNNCHADSPEMSYEDIKKRSTNVEGIIYEVS